MSAAKAEAARAILVLLLLVLAVAFAIATLPAGCFVEPPNPLPSTTGETADTSSSSG